MFGAQSQCHKATKYDHNKAEEDNSLSLSAKIQKMRQVARVMLMSGRERPWRPLSSGTPDRVLGADKVMQDSFKSI